MFDCREVKEGDVLRYTGVTGCCFRHGVDYEVRRDFTILVIRLSCFADYGEDRDVRYLDEDEFELVERNGPW